MEAIILIANNNGAGMKGVRHPLLPRGECCCYLPPATGGSVPTNNPFSPGSQAGQPRRGAVWPPGRGVPRGPAAPALARWPSARRGGTGSPSLAPRTWPHPGPLGRERPGKGQDGGGEGGGIEGLGQEGSAVRQELGKEGKELRGGSAALAQSLASGAAEALVAKGPRGTPNARCSTP